VRFFGKKPEQKHSGLGDRMLNGAKKRTGAVRPKKRVWLLKVIAFAVAGAAMGEVLGAIAGRMTGYQQAGVIVGCAFGALAGAGLGEGNAVEALLGAVLGGALAFADYYLFQWGGVQFSSVAQVSLVGPAGAFLGVAVGRALTSGEKKTQDTKKEN